MTQDEIISMAREVGAPGWWTGETDSNVPGRDWLSRFAALVAAKAAAEEREACTAACEKIKQQAEGIAKSRFMTDAGKDLHNAIAAPAQPVPAPGEPSEAPTQAQVDERSDTVWLFIRLGQKNIRRAITLLEIDSMRAPELAFGPLLLKAIAELRKT